MTEHISVITRSRRVTVPNEVLEELGLKQGDTLEWVRENGHIEVRRARSVTERTAGIGRRFAKVPTPTIEELKDAAEQAWAESGMAGEWDE